MIPGHYQSQRVILADAPSRVTEYSELKSLATEEIFADGKSHAVSIQSKSAAAQDSNTLLDMPSESKVLSE